MKKRILVTGACGYIGSHTAVQLIENDFQLVSVDNFCNSDISVLDAIEKITGTRPEHHTIDLDEDHAVQYLLDNVKNIDGVIHFAALKSVNESVEYPMLYFLNNMRSLMNVLSWMDKAQVKNFIFSSSCTVYGNPDVIPVTEQSPILPASSPYGRTKQLAEMMLEDLHRLEKIKVISLRYFNPAGAHASGLMGESPINPALNLVPVITETCIGLRQELMVFGTDYNTRDGSCIRDFIHVVDLANAHVLALEKLFTNYSKDYPFAINLGTGHGISVLEAIDAFEKANHLKVPVRIGQRRPGDVPSIYADNQLAQSFLGWSPKLSLQEIMRSAWEWEKTRGKS